MKAKRVTFLGCKSTLNKVLTADNLDNAYLFP